MSIAFIEHVVFEEGITTDLKKIEKICNQRQGRDKKYIGTWKLLQALHKELLCDNNSSAETALEICPLHVG